MDGMEIRSQPVVTKTVISKVIRTITYTHENLYQHERNRDEHQDK